MLRRSVLPVVALSLSSLVAFASGCAPSAGDDDAEDWENAAEDDGALRVCSDGKTVQGVDVSYWQGAIDWPKVATTDVRFAIVRASYGSEFEDPRFDENWRGAKEAGLVRGAYQFFRPSQSAKAQADLLLDMLADDPLGDGDLPAVLDVEVTEGKSNAAIRAAIQVWLDAVEQGTGKRPIVYTAAFMQSTVGTGFSDYPLWVANYTTQCPLLPTGWGEWNMWQYSDKGHVAGISGNVDRDVFNGSIDDLHAFANGAPESDPPPADDPPPSNDPPGAPTGLTPAEGATITTDAVDLGCDAVPGASSYSFEIEFYDEGDDRWEPYYEYDTNSPKKTFWPVLDAPFRFRVRAKVAGDWSPSSDYRSFTYGG